MVEVTCGVCGTQFESFVSRKRRFCSGSCAASYRTKKRIAEGTFHNPRRLRRGDEVPCETCGVPVYRNKSQAAQNKRFCSEKCAAYAQRKPAVIKQCEWCDKELVLKPSQAAKRFCSKKCESLADVKRPLERVHNGKRGKLDQYGYVMLWEPDHPNKTMKGWQYEHRLVAESVVGRYLTSDEQVHHINGVKGDNRPENLEVLDAQAHRLITVREYHEKLQSDRAELEEYRKRFGPIE